MGGKRGYSYGYKFSLGDLSEIKSEMLTVRSRSGYRPVVLEMRTVFTIFRRRTRKGGVREILGEETFDICMIYENSTVYAVNHLVADRLNDYWLTKDDIEKFCKDTVAYVRKIAGEHGSLYRIPVYVDFEVCTVQKEGEVYTATEARAIKPTRLVPTYLVHFSTPPPDVVVPNEFRDFYEDLPRTRVENIDEGLAIMSTCTLCSKGPDIADQIAKLRCGCHFHSHCVVGWLEKDHHCPICQEKLFARCDSPFFYPPRDTTSNMDIWCPRALSDPACPGLNKKSTS